jgi:hypothetical protein
VAQRLPSVRSCVASAVHGRLPDARQIVVSSRAVSSPPRPVMASTRLPPPDVTERTGTGQLRELATVKYAISPVPVKLAAMRRH